MIICLHYHFKMIFILIIVIMCPLIFNDYLQKNLKFKALYLIVQLDLLNTYFMIESLFG
jgi:hypothetical protein